MYLYGASGHAKVIIDILESSGFSVSGLFDDNPSLKELDGRKVMGKYRGQALDAPLIISIGDNAVRARILQGLLSSMVDSKKESEFQNPLLPLPGGNSFYFGKAIHPTAILSKSVEVGEGTVVMHGAIVQAASGIGKHVIVNTGAKVDHDCVVGDFAHISPGAVLCGGVQLGEGTLLGAGAVVVPGIKIGRWCRIGAGAIVLKDIPDNCTAVGNPARIINV